MFRIGRIFGFALRRPLIIKNSIKPRSNLRCYCVITPPKENLQEEQEKIDERIKNHAENDTSNVSSEKPSPEQSKIQSANLAGLHEQRVDRVKSLNSYKLMKLMIEQKKPIDDPNILVKGLVGVRIFRRDTEFINIYTEWWKLLTDNLNKLQIEKICDVFALLGDLNVFTKTLRRKLDREQIHVLLSKILEADFNKLSFKSISSVYRGLQRLQSSTDSDDFVPKELIKKTVNRLNSVQKDDDMFEETAISGVFILCSLSKMGYALDQYSLQAFLKSSTALFERISTLTGDELKYYFAFNKFVLTVNRFVEAFRIWQINADDIVSNVWQNWFAASMNLMIISPKFETLQKYDSENETSRNAVRETDDDDAIELKKIYHKQIFAMDMTQLCTASSDIASRFNKLDLFTNPEFKKRWNEVLEKQVPETKPLCVSRLYHSLRSLETIIKSKSLPRGDEMNPEQNTHVSPELWTIIRQKVDERMKEKKGQSTNSWKSFERTPSSFQDGGRDFGGEVRDGGGRGVRDFGGGFREFRGQRFERPNDVMRQNFDQRGGSTSRRFDSPSQRLDSSSGRFDSSSKRFDSSSKDERGFRPRTEGRRKSGGDGGDIFYKENETDYTTFRGRPSLFSRLENKASSRKGDDDDDFDEDFSDSRRSVSRRSGASNDFEDDEDDRRVDRKFRRAEAEMDDDFEEAIQPKSHFDDRRSFIKFRRSEAQTDEEFEDVEPKPRSFAGRGRGRGRLASSRRNTKTDDDDE